MPSDIIDSTIPVKEINDTQYILVLILKVCSQNRFS